MSEPRRWVADEPPPQVLRLLEVGVWERPSREALEQAVIRARFATEAVARSPLVAVEPGRAARSVTKWAVLGVLLLGAAAALAPRLMSRKGAGRELTHPPAAPVEDTALHRTAVRGHERAGDGDAASEAQAGAAASPPAGSGERLQAGVPAAAKPIRSQPQSTIASGARPSTGKVCKPAVAEQIELLERAKSEIRSGNGAKALATLDRYDRFGAGRCFVLESLKYRMDAAQQTGNSTEARRIAKVISTQYPDTAQAREAAALIGK